MMLGNATLMVGIGEDTPEGLKVYIGHRCKNTYVLVTDEDAKEECRRAWSDVSVHVILPLPPPECVYVEGED